MREEKTGKGMGPSDGRRKKTIAKESIRLLLPSLPHLQAPHCLELGHGCGEERQVRSSSSSSRENEREGEKAVFLFKKILTSSSLERREEVEKRK